MQLLNAIKWIDIFEKKQTLNYSGYHSSIFEQQSNKTLLGGIITLIFFILCIMILADIG
jgi:hypothetical protein